MTPRSSSSDLSVAFVIHHSFRSNSGIQIFNLANALVGLGVRCTAIVPGDTSSVEFLGEPRFDILAYSRARRVHPRIVHACTPRKNVRAVTEKLVRKNCIPYIVHLEDNEDLILADAAGLPHERLWLAEAGSGRYRYFLEGAAGVMAVNETLLDFKPEGVPGTVIWPAHEEDLFKPQLADGRLRVQLGLAADDRIVVYNGNAHSLNAAEIRSLYLAVGLVNRHGTPLKLIRLGDDYIDFLGTNAAELEAHVVHSSYLPRAEVPRYLALADVLVQPGRPDLFNDYRFPSKLPEFLAMGKPVILPRSNIGRHLQDGHDCLLLETGEPEELARRIQECLDDPALCERLGAGARRFAEANFSWSRNAETLLRFYESVLG